MRSISVVLENAGQGSVDAAPLRLELGDDARACRGEAVEALLALVFLAPLTGEQALGFQAPEEGIERALVDREASIREGLPERVAVVLAAELAEDGQHQRATPELEA